MVFWACHRPIGAVLSNNNPLIFFGQVTFWQSGMLQSSRAVLACHMLLGVLAGMPAVQQCSSVQVLAYMTGYICIPRDAWVGLSTEPLTLPILNTCQPRKTETIGG
jgi:hypothetical protein